MSDARTRAAGAIRLAQQVAVVLRVLALLDLVGAILWGAAALMAVLPAAWVLIGSLVGGAVLLLALAAGLELGISLVELRLEPPVQ